MYYVHVVSWWIRLLRKKTTFKGIGVSSWTLCGCSSSSLTHQQTCYAKWCYSITFSTVSLNYSPSLFNLRLWFYCTESRLANLCGVGLWALVMDAWPSSDPHEVRFWQLVQKQHCGEHLVRLPSGCTILESLVTNLDIVVVLIVCTSCLTILSVISTTF